MLSPAYAQCRGCVRWKEQEAWVLSLMWCKSDAVYWSIKMRTGWIWLFTFNILIRCPETETISGVSEPNRFDEPSGFFPPNFTDINKLWEWMYMSRFLFCEFTFLLNKTLQIHFVSRSSPIWPVVASQNTVLRFLKPGPSLVGVKSVVIDKWLSWVWKGGNGNTCAPCPIPVPGLFINTRVSFISH